MSYYRDRIAAHLEYLHCGEIDPRHVEAYMRLAHSTLDGLSPEQFSAEVEIGVACAIEDGGDNAECCARSFGL